jgi:branched-chain amino acid aminotransferase
MTIWLNGQIFENGLIDASNAGVTLGWGVFTTIGIKGGMPLFLGRHIERLARDAQTADIPLHHPREEIEAGLAAVLKSNAVPDGLARLTLTRRGDGRWNDDQDADLSIMAHEAIPSSGELRVQLSPYRIEARRPLAGVKTTSYLSTLWAWREAKAQGFDEAILRDGNDFLSEGARSNLFWIKSGALFTPSLETGCLRGLGRDLVLEWARAQSITVHESQFPFSEALDADQAYVVSAATGPRPITSWHDEEGELLHQWPGGSELIHELKKWWDDASTS